jgi:acyl CoA:acetate/3-ketoacid CoA transferase
VKRGKRDILAGEVVNVRVSCCGMRLVVVRSDCIRLIVVVSDDGLERVGKVTYILERAVLELSHDFWMLLGVAVDLELG